MFAIPENRRRRRPAPTLLHCHKVEGLIVDVGRRAAVAEAVRCGLETFQVQGFHGRGEHLFEFSERQGEEQHVALNFSLFVAALSTETIHPRGEPGTPTSSVSSCLGDVVLCRRAYNDGPTTTHSATRRGHMVFLDVQDLRRPQVQVETYEHRRRC